MASSFLSSLLSKTSQVTASVRRWAASPSSSSDPRGSVLKDLKKLERTLKRIHAVLNDAEEREIREEAVKLWLKELKEVAYDAEDVLDEYHYEILRAQVEGGASRRRKRVEGDDEEEVSGSLSNIMVSIPDGMGDRIREIRERFDEISEHRERLRLREEDGERHVVGAPYPAPTSHKVDESRIFGREHDKKKVIDLLLSEGMGINGISVIPIVGKGGLGKTTIAQLVYNDSKVKKYFDLTGWVCVSDDFNVPRLTKAIIKSLTQTETPHDLTELSPLQNMLKEKVKGKRVLLVLDDVWNEQQGLWESLSIPFFGEETVRIIVTCRNEKVAEIMQTVHPYRPGYLSPEQSWSLFRHYAFGGRDPVEQPRLVDIGKQIVDKCSGLPLAVKTIGSLLRHEIDEDGWMEVLQSDLWELDNDNETLASLRLSYNRMPSNLKPCFVYCSIFLKDYKFDKDVLVRLWMAQGYIPPQGRRRMEDIGDEYFNDLLRRSFFDSSYHDGFYEMHDMIHDLAKLIAGNEYYTIVDNKLPCSPDEVRHLCIEDAWEIVDPLYWYNFRALRTLLLCHGYRHPTGNHQIIKFPRLLKCLEFSWVRKDETLDLLRNLKHLRYLKIQIVSIKRLPESVCLLYHLQTLIIHSDSLEELPDGLGNLINLRHLDIRFTNIRCLTNGIRKLTNLQSLQTHCKVQDRIGVLKHLVNLPTLFISGLRNVVNIEDAKDAGLKHKHKVQRLFLYWNAVNYRYGLDWHDEVDDTLLHLEAFPEEIKDVPADEKREEAMLEYLQPHTNLKKLLINGYGGSQFPEWVGNPFSFASLREIHIIGCQNVRSLPLYLHDSLGKLGTPIPKEPLPSMLERVYISGCQQLTSIAGLHNLHSLKILKICNCPQLRLLSEEGLPSKLQDLHIECQQLISLLGMQNLTSLRALTIKNCPKLQIMAEDQLSYRPHITDIVDCRRLVDWCQIQKINYIQVALGNKLTISNTWANIKHGFDYLTSTEHGFDELSASTDELLQPRSHLYFGNSWTFFEERPLPVLEELTIWSCMHIPPLEHLPELTSLQRLVVKDCPGVRLLRDELLPSTLKSLVVDSCENLRCLQLVQQNRDALEELQIVNCPEIVMVQGLNRPFFPKLLTIEQCPKLLLSQDDWRPFIPPCAEIVGELEMKLYPPHSEETENKETIDDGTQEKQVLDCVMIENANSAVSSIFDATDDCNMGQFLQLGLPSGCSSQCPVQNNAEPSTRSLWQ